MTSTAADNQRTLRTGPFAHYAWVVLVVLFVGLLSAQGVRLAFGAFIEPWEDSFSISRGTVSFVALVSYLIYGFAQPIVGKFADRMHLPRLFAMGLVIISVGLVITTTVSSATGLTMAYGVLASVGFGISASVVASVLIARWFVARRGMAFGIVEAGFGAGQLVLVPLSLFAIARIGWRPTMLIFAGLLACVIAPLCLLLVHDRPEDVGLEPLGGPDVDLEEDEARDLSLLARKEFWFLGVPFFVCGITTTGLVDTHLIEFAHDHGNSSTVAGAAVSVLAVFNIIGTASAGLLVDRFDPRHMLGWLYALRAVSLVVVLFLNEGFWLLQFSVLFGLVDFATVAPTQTLVSRYFGPRSLGFVFGLVLTSHQIGSAIGSYIPGRLHDATGSYTSSFVAAAATLVVASALSFLLPAPAVPARSLLSDAP